MIVAGIIIIIKVRKMAKEELENRPAYHQNVPVVSGLAPGATPGAPMAGYSNPAAPMEGFSSQPGAMVNPPPYSEAVAGGNSTGAVEASGGNDKEDGGALVEI